MLARLTWLQRQNNRYEWYQFGPFKEKWICKSFQRILKLQARQSYPLVTQDSDTRRRPSAVQRHTESIICGVSGEEPRPSLIEADGHQSSRRYESQSWRSLGAQEDRLQLLHPSDCLHTSFLISPSFLSSRLRCSTLASFFFFSRLY